MRHNRILPKKDGLIITRIVVKEEVEGITYFGTKSDGEGAHIWPEAIREREHDNWHDYRENYTMNGMISEKLLVVRLFFEFLGWGI